MKTGPVTVSSHAGPAESLGSEFVRPCPTCAAPLAADQRYCLACGARDAPPRVEWRALLGPPPKPAERAAPARAHGLPAPRAAATLLLVVLGFGVVVGGALSPGVDRTLASGGPLTVVLPPAPVLPAPVPPPPLPPAEPAPPAALPEPAPPPPSAPVPPPAATAPAPGPAVTHQQEEAPPPAVPQPRHVFVVVLPRTTVEAVPYLAKTAARGVTLSEFRAIGHSTLAGQLAMLAGQRPNPATVANCPVHSPVQPGTVDEAGQAEGEGCVYGLDTFTVADQLLAQGRGWKAYVEGQGGELGTCRRPPEGAPDPFYAPRPGDPYVTWRNPFVFFQTVVTTTECAARDVGLDALATDLASSSEDAPALSWVVAPQSPEALDAWLRSTLPAIERSPAYADDGLMIVVPEAAPDPGPGAAPGTALRTGALVLGEWVEPGATVKTRYDQWSLLRTLGELFSLRPLAAAAGDDVEAFGRRVWARYEPPE